MFGAKNIKFEDRSRDRTRTPLIGTSRRTLLLAVRGGAGAALVSFSVGFWLLPLILTSLGRDLFGSWVALSALLTICALADVGVRTEIARRVAAANGMSDQSTLVRAVHEGTTLIAMILFPVTCGCVILAPVLARLVFANGVPGHGLPEVVLLLRCLFVLTGVNLVLDAHFSVLRGIQRGDIEARAQMASVSCSAAVTLLGLRAGWGIWALFAALVAATTVSAGIRGLSTRRVMPTLRFRLVRIRLRALSGFLTLSGLALMSQISDVLDSQWDKLVLAHIVGGSAVAYFHIGTSLVAQAKVLAILPMAPLMVATAELGRSAPHRALDLQRQLMKVGMVSAAVTLGTTYILAPTFIHLWLGDAYRSAGVVAQLFCVAVLLNLISAPLTFRAFAEGLHRLAAIGAVTNLVVNGVASLLLTLSIGLYGAVYGSIAGNLAGTLVFLWLARGRLTGWVAPPLRAVSVSTLIVAAATLIRFPKADSWLDLLVLGVGVFILIGSVAVLVERLSIRELLGQARCG